MAQSLSHIWKGLNAKTRRRQEAKNSISIFSLCSLFFPKKLCYPFRAAFKPCPLLIVFSLLTNSSFALETKPWLNEVYEFDFQSAFSYSRFNKVQGASKQLEAPLNNRDLLVDFGFTPASSVDIQIEGEFGKTNNVNWALRSGALQMRYQLLDDIAGDCCSLMLGVNIRGATHHFLRDVSTPYAQNLMRRRPVLLEKSGR